MLNYTNFLDSFFEEIKKINLDVSKLELDHIAYQASSSEDYDQVKKEFLKLGSEVGEEVIGGRRVSVYQLNEPFIYDQHTIPVLELVEPKPEQNFKSDFQHAEFVYNEPFESLIEKYPNINWDVSSMHRDEFAHLKLNFKNGLTLKFLHEPIVKMFEDKQN